MTVSTNFNFNPNVGEIMRSGMQMAGLLPLGQLMQPAQAADARRLLGLRLESMQARGVLLSTLEQKTLQLIPSQASYVIPEADTIDIHGDAMVQQVGFTQETIALQFPWANYQILVDKTILGVPTQFYVEKAQASVTVFLWPVPQVSATLKYRRIRLLRNADSDGVTADLWQRQLRLLTLYVAHDLALAGPLTLPRVQYLAGLVEKEEKIVFGDSSAKGPLQFMLPSHRY